MSNATLQRADAAPPGPRASTISNLLANYGLLFVFLLIMLVFGLLRPSSFFSATNINAILVSQSVTAILALAVMVPLATKQFDLSIGYHLGMAQVLIVGLQVTTGLAWPAAAALILLASMLVGFVNGLSVTYFPHRFLHRHDGHWNTALRGDQLVHERRTNRRNELAGQLYGADPDRPRHSPSGHLRRRSLRRSLWIVTERLPVGRNLYVIGANVRAAELTGINVRRHVMGAFIVAGLLSSFAGLVLGSILQTGTPSVGPEYLLPAFAASLLGATSIKPGRVNVIGTLLSVLVLAFSFSGVQQLGAPFYVQFFFNGAILIVAVGLSVYAAQRRQRAATASKSGAG